MFQETTHAYHKFNLIYTQVVPAHTVVTHAAHYINCIYYVHPAIITPLDLAL